MIKINKYDLKQKKYKSNVLLIFKLLCCLIIYYFVSWDKLLKINNNMIMQIVFTILVIIFFLLVFPLFFKVIFSVDLIRAKGAVVFKIMGIKFFVSKFYVNKNGLQFSKIKNKQESKLEFDISEMIEQTEFVKSFLKKINLKKVELCFFCGADLSMQQALEKTCFENLALQFAFLFSSKFLTNIKSFSSGGKRNLYIMAKAKFNCSLIQIIFSLISAKFYKKKDKI